jgi:peptide subunit release factor RF-3
MRWLSPDAPIEQLATALPSGTKLAFDAEQRPVLLFPSEWAIAYFQKQNKGIAISDLPFSAGGGMSVLVAASM